MLCGRGSCPITPIYELLTFHFFAKEHVHQVLLRYLYIFTRVTACTDRRMDGQTVNRNSTRFVILIIYIWVYNPLSNLTIFRWYKQPVAEKHYYTL